MNKITKRFFEKKHVCQSFFKQAEVPLKKRRGGPEEKRKTPSVALVKGECSRRRNIWN